MWTIMTSRNSQGTIYVKKQMSIDFVIHFKMIFRNISARHFIHENTTFILFILHYLTPIALGSDDDHCYFSECF